MTQSYSEADYSAFKIMSGAERGQPGQNHIKYEGNSNSRRTTLSIFESLRSCRRIPSFFAVSQIYCFSHSAGKP